MPPELNGDPFPRRTATPANLLPWVGRILRDLPAQVGLYARRPPIDRGLRERIMMAVTDVNGCRYCSWIHGGWAELMRRGEKARDEIALAYARESAELGLLPPSDEAREALEAVFTPAEVRAIDAAISNIEVANLAGNTVDGLIARLTGARPRDPVAMLQEAAVVAAAAPVGLPLLALGSAFRRAASQMPSVDIEVVNPAGEANMGVLMLTELIRKYRDFPLLRALAAGRLPFALGITAEGLSATARVRKPSVVELENGIADDAALLLEGDMGAMLEVAQEPGKLVRFINEGRLVPSAR